MPIFDFVCKGCGHRFETLVRGTAKPECPSCECHDLDRMFSLPAVHSSVTKGKSLRAAKKRDAAQGKDRMHAQLQYERSHDRHG